MFSLNVYLLTFLLVACCDVGRCEMTIEGISRICHTPTGRLGRCSSMERCHHHAGCDRKASTSPCSNGLGDPPYVCCVFGKGIVFPDDDFGVESRSIGASAVASNMASQPRGGGAILFPDENGKFHIPTVQQSEVKLKSAVAASVQSMEMDMFPKPPFCGPMSLGDKIHGGREAELGEFPWLANLEYRTENGDLDMACAGNIINNRYVLTAGHCVRGEIEVEVGKLESLRVGDHNIAAEMDCDELSCLEPFQRFNVIETIVHEEYLYTKKRRIFNDIALLKTDRSIVYSFSVAPICLPDALPTLQPPLGGARLTVAGWGHNGTVFTDEKRIVDVPLIDNENCTLRVIPTQLCAGGVVGKDSCTGDSGGSLARRTGRGWIMEGMVSYGRNCGTENPAIYTRVRSFLPWIHEKIEGRTINTMRANVSSQAHSIQQISINSIVAFILMLFGLNV